MSYVPRPYEQPDVAQSHDQGFEGTREEWCSDPPIRRHSPHRDNNSHGSYGNVEGPRAVVGPPSADELRQVRQARRVREAASRRDLAAARARA